MAWLAGLFAKNPPRRIFAPGREHIGDVVNLTGPLMGLRSLFPTAFIAAEVGERAAPLLAGFPYVDEVWPRKTRQGLHGKLQHVARLRSAKFDLAVLLDDSNDLVLQAALGGIPLRVGIWRGKKYESLFHALTPYQLDRHEVRDHGAEVLRLLGLPDPPRQPVLFPSADDEAAAEAAWSRSGLPPGAIGIHPGASAASKRWAPDRFAALALKLGAQGLEVALVGGRDDAPLLDEVSRLAGGLRRAAEPMGVLAFACLLRRFRLLVCHDSGPMHLAAAMGVPTVALFGPAYLEHSAPWGEGHRLLRGGCDCPLRTFSGCHRTCIDSLVVEDVAASVLQSLGRQA